jgi:SNF2 family DNA or RNA helicase
MIFDLAQLKTVPTTEQIDGMKLVYQDPTFGLFDTMGFGKSKQSIDGACQLYEDDIIDTVLLTCPASLKFNWTDPDLGQLGIHNWANSHCMEFDSSDTFIPSFLPPTGGAGGRPPLLWVVTSYDYAKWSDPRSKLTKQKKGADLLVNELRGQRVLHLADEAHYLSNHKSLRTQSWTWVRREIAQRAGILTGTPFGNRYYLNLYAMFEFLDPRILNFKNYYHFRARHTQMGGHENQQVLQWFDTDVIDRKIAPHILRRDKIPGLREKRYTVLEVPLSPTTWKMYKQMRDECLVWLDSGETVTAQHAFTRILRLSQLTSGLLGGLDDDGELREISPEKSDFILGWFDQFKETAGALRYIIWCRFRQEIFRLQRVLAALGVPIFTFIGGQGKREREAGIHEFQDGSRDRNAILLAQPKAGGLGNNFFTCHCSFYVSNDRNLIDRQQSEDRTWRRGQLNDCQYWDLLATGPQGQKTIDHHILKKLRAGIVLNTLTLSEWRHFLTEE